VVHRIVAQPTSTLDFRQAIDAGKVILVQLDGRMGGENRTFIGALMMYKLFGAVMSRLDVPEEQRRQVAICVDEFQTFVAQSGYADKILALDADPAMTLVLTLDVEPPPVTLADIRDSTYLLTHNTTPFHLELEPIWASLN